MKFDRHEHERRTTAEFWTVNAKQLLDAKETKHKPARTIDLTDSIFILAIGSGSTKWIYRYWIQIMMLFTPLSFFHFSSSSFIENDVEAILFYLIVEASRLGTQDKNTFSPIFTQRTEEKISICCSFWFSFCCLSYWKICS